MGQPKEVKSLRTINQPLWTLMDLSESLLRHLKLASTIAKSNQDQPQHRKNYQGYNATPQQGKLQAEFDRATGWKFQKTNTLPQKQLKQVYYNKKFEDELEVMEGEQFQTPVDRTKSRE